MRRRRYQKVLILDLPPGWRRRYRGRSSPAQPQSQCRPALDCRIDLTRSGSMSAAYSLRPGAAFSPHPSSLGLAGRTDPGGNAGRRRLKSGRFARREFRPDRRLRSSDQLGEKASHGGGIDHRDSRPKSRQPSEMRHIERQQVGHLLCVSNVNKVGHYSYNPSLLKAEWGRDTPQSVASPRTIRSQSSWDANDTLGAKNRSRKTLLAKTSGATPWRRADSVRAASSSGLSLITILSSPVHPHPNKVHYRREV